jgi:acetylornithine deacetylase
MTPLHVLEHWLSIDSTTGRERAFAEALETFFTEQGLTVERQPVTDERFNIRAAASSDVDVLLCTHIDTVPPFFGPRRDGDRLRARGACDTKGGLFAMWRAWESMPADDRARVGFLLVVGEEVDHVGAEVAAQTGWPGLRHIILCEPTRNRLARGQKGILKVAIHAEGKAGHSAFPETGYSAVHALVAVLGDLLAESWPSHPQLGPTTLNIGVIEGGVAANVFAPSARAEILVRAVTDPNALQERIEAIVAGRARVERLCANPPVELAWWAGFETDVVPFNTDAPYLYDVAPITLVGPGDIRTAHSPDEHIALPDLDAGVELYRRLLRGLLHDELPK